jgi:hypothetical protein
MRKYYLASSTDRGDVDLRQYQKEITEAVHRYMPGAQVEVAERYYTVDPTPDKGNAIKIGRLLSDKDILGKYCVKIPKLFCSEEVEHGKEVEDGREKKRTGGHQ